MIPLSIVIICRNEETVIGRTLKSLEGITDDIVIYDNGSNDATIDIAKKLGAKIYEGPWEGFGVTKARATALATHDWILNLDADEALDQQLRANILQESFSDPMTVYNLSFQNFIGDKPLKHGEWGGDSHVRIFNRTKVKWNDAPVHEQLLKPAGIKIARLKGKVLHYTARNIEDYAMKMTRYAMLNGQKYFEQNKKASWWKIHFAPSFSFFTNYILKAGFLDGHAGYVCAKINAHYTFLKYSRLRELTEGKG